jgi:ArsR family transcriptional regulator, lead/cadmium/zinc/bismuth-responsive transcriptional repressor
MSNCSYIHMSTDHDPAQNDVCDGVHPALSDAASRRASLIGARTVEALAETFRALGDPTRVRILDALAAGELCVCDIASLVGISESAASHQLRLLRGLRLVRPRRAGRQVYYAVDDHHILELLNQARTHVEEAQVASRTVPLHAGIPESVGAAVRSAAVSRTPGGAPR